MKTFYQIYILLAMVACSLSSCELDNYKGPDASLSGFVKDIDGGTLIEQDIENGSKIIHREYGYANPEEQQMIFMVNGEYNNRMIFSGTYDIYFNETNFVKPDTLKGYVINKGANKLDFTVQPYIRVSDVSITKSGDEIVAVFTITPTVDHKIKQIGLFGHIDRVVGNPYALQRKTQDINEASKNTPKQYTLKFATSGFKSGQEYYFRVGAIIDVPNAKYNYAPALRLKI
jgi:hypothetical protein